MNAVKRRAIFERLAAAMPDPKTELDYRTPFELLVAVVLSAQATDKGVNKATAKLFPVASTPKQIVALGVEGLMPYISSIGLFRNKAKNLVALSQALLDEHDGEVPASAEALQKLPGVGRKTASVVLNVAFGQPVIPVDTHIFRVSNRTGIAPGRDPDAVADALERTVPDEFRLGAHHWLILHGRYVCIARKPLCPQCVIRELCEYRDKTPDESLVTASRSRKETAVRKVAVEPAAGVSKPRGTRPPAARKTAQASARAAPRTGAGAPRPRGAQPFAKTARAATGRGSGGGRKR